MKRPRFRITVRRLMVAEVIVAGALTLATWAERRRAAFVLEASTHEATWMKLAPDGPELGLPPRMAYHAAMAKKYRRAADNPWLPVWSDPPEPE